VPNIEELANALAPVISEAVQASATVLRDEFAEQVKALRVEVSETIQGIEQDPEALAKAAAELVQVPEPQVLTLDEVLPTLQADLQKAIDALPIPKDGKDAEPVTVEDFKSLFESEQAKWALEWERRANDHLQKAIDRLVTPLDSQVAPLLAQLKEALASAARVPTAEDFKPIYEGEQAKWALDFERRAQDQLQKAIDRIEPPKDGRDGFSLDDFDAELLDDGRTVRLSFSRGDVSQVKELRLATVIDAGIYRADREEPYFKGDGVTWDGCFWVAQKDMPEGKPGASTDWRMAVKKGRDGKGTKGDKGDPGKNGRPGRDLTQLGFNGEKH